MRQRLLVALCAVFATTLLAMQAIAKAPDAKTDRTKDAALDQITTTEMVPATAPEAVGVPNGADLALFMKDDADNTMPMDAKAKDDNPGEVENTAPNDALTLTVVNHPAMAMTLAPNVAATEVVYAVNLAAGVLTQSAARVPTAQYNKAAYPPDDQKFIHAQEFAYQTTAQEEGGLGDAKMFLGATPPSMEVGC